MTWNTTYRQGVWLGSKLAWQCPGKEFVYEGREVRVINSFHTCIVSPSLSDRVNGALVDERNRENETVDQCNHESQPGIKST